MGVDTGVGTGMDIIAVQEAKKVKKMVGETKRLQTDTKENTVGAINELKQSMARGKAPVCLELDIPNVDTGEVRALSMPFTGSCFIKGIKVTGNAFTGEFNLKLYTKPPFEGGTYVYYSGKAVNVIWDIMDIPFTDESGEKKIYVVLENKGALSHFLLQIYVLKG